MPKLNKKINSSPSVGGGSPRLGGAANALISGGSLIASIIHHQPKSALSASKFFLFILIIEVLFYSPVNSDDYVTSNFAGNSVGTNGNSNVFGGGQGVGGLTPQQPQYPKGYYPFEESPAKIPPRVRKPPYLQTQVNCPGVGSLNSEQTLDNLCGDLNKGYLPLNPIGQGVDGVSYPFDLIKKKTLEFFSKTLPILKADDTLPKVAKYEDDHITYNPGIFNSKPSSRISFYHHRNKRSSEEPEQSETTEQNEETQEILTNRQGRSNSEQPPATQGANGAQKAGRADGKGWCEDSHGVFCMLFNVFNGGKKDKNGPNDRVDDDIPSLSQINSLEAPMTPCPSAFEYVTPVFAKNYQGVWRYVVQIPYEGYFTQTVEVVKCLSTKCAYLDGSCLASPRWVSLLVAEIYYPDTTFPTPGGAASSSANGGSSRQPVQGGLPPRDVNNGYFSKRQGQPTPSEKCDGTDELGCYQVRLYYDWFLIPGSCKCWKNDFFDQYRSKK